MDISKYFLDFLKLFFVAFGKEIKRLREQSNYSAKKMADLMNVDVERLRKWEQRDQDPRDEDTEKIEAFFQMPINEAMKLKSLPKVQKVPLLKMAFSTEDLLKDNLQLRALVKTLYNRVAKHEAKIYGISIDEALNQMDDDTTISLKELMKELKQ